jgi:hypothetical protein
VIRSHQHRWLGLAVLLLFLLVGLSLVANGLLIRRLLELRERAGAVLDDLLVLTESIGDDVIVVPVEIDETFPVSASVPFEYEDTLPIDTDVPISTTVAVPVQLLGRVVEFEVPVQITVPISYGVPIAVRQKVEVNTSVPVQIETTIELPLSNTPIGSYMEQLRAAIQRLQEEESP